MATYAGRESAFADALAGSGGTADSGYPPMLAADVFPDALSATALGGLRPPLPIGAPVPAAGGSPGGVPGLLLARPRPAPSVAAAPPVRVAPPVRPAHPLPIGPSPAQPAQLYVPAPTSAQLAAGTGRRPAAGTGYQGESVPGGWIRPPAYLPQGQGLAQVRSTITQARSASARQARAARSSAKKNSGAWGFLVAVIVLLVTTGAGQKIISLINDVLQRK